MVSPILQKHITTIILAGSYVHYFDGEIETCKMVFIDSNAEIFKTGFMKALIASQN